LMSACRTFHFDTEVVNQLPFRSCNQQLVEFKLGKAVSCRIFGML
jgi:hypothetical protein